MHRLEPLGKKWIQAGWGGGAVVKVADDVRGHSTDSLIHKDHVDVVTVALIHFVALIHG